MRWADAVVFAAIVAAPPAFANQAYDALHRLYDHPRTLRLEAVPVCFDHGCGIVKRVRIDDANWHRVTTHLIPAAPDAAAERVQIGRAIAEMERITGQLAGTSGDLGGSLASLTTLEPQMDCIDESSNTTTYLTLFEQRQLLRWHRVEPRAHRGYLLFGGWPHYSAVIRERPGGRFWAVDSWFRDNGEPPDIVKLETWEAGWSPRESVNSP